MNNAPIGFFDSGSGGLSILTSVWTTMPLESTLYVGDHAFLPYGGKTPEFIQSRGDRIISYLLRHGCKLIVVACNTATVAGIEHFRKKFPQIPIVGVVPVVKTAAQMTKTKRFVILSTEYTAQSEYQKKLIDTWARDCEVANIGSSTLVPLIEQGNLTDPRITMELQRIFEKINIGMYDVVVLGCTHYPFLRSVIQKVVGNHVTVIDSAAAVARQVKRVLTNNNLLGESPITRRFVTTGESKIVGEIYSHLLGISVSADHETL